MDLRIIENLFFIHAQFLFSASIYNEWICPSVRLSARSTLRAAVSGLYTGVECT